SKASKADSDIAKDLKAQLLLIKNICIILKANLYIEAKLINGVLEMVYNILFEDNQSSPSLSIIVFIEFDNYNSSAVEFTKYKKLVPIYSIQHT
ncbi:7619_t:CDS:1, partial [Ambispora leptoticha]